MDQKKTSVKKPSVAKLVRDLERTRVKLSYYRDKLRETQDELESLLEPTEKGIESLQIAIDELSEQA